MNPDPSQNEEFERRQEPLVEALFAEIAACAPQNWTMATLELDVKSTKPGGSFSISHRLRDPSSRQVLPRHPDSLAAVVGKLQALSRDYHRAWVRATFTVVFTLKHPQQPRRALLKVANFEIPPAPPRRGSVRLAGDN